MQSLRAVKPKSNWFGFVTFIVQESRSLTVIGAIFCILYKECVKSALVTNIGYSVVYFKPSLSGTFPI